MGKEAAREHLTDWADGAIREGRPNLQYWSVVYENKNGTRVIFSGLGARYVSLLEVHQVGLKKDGVVKRVGKINFSNTEKPLESVAHQVFARTDRIF